MHRENNSPLIRLFQSVDHRLVHVDTPSRILLSTNEYIDASYINVKFLSENDFSWKTFSLDLRTNEWLYCKSTTDN